MDPERRLGEIRVVNLEEEVRGRKVRGRGRVMLLVCVEMLGSARMGER